MDKATIGKRIREQRKIHKLTLEKFASLAGIGTVYLGEIERGEKMPSLSTFVKMVNALDISADILLRDEVNAAKPYILNEITEAMKDLSPKKLNIISNVVSLLADNMNDLYEISDDEVDGK